jgi:hypothetical protein
MLLRVCVVVPFWWYVDGRDGEQSCLALMFGVQLRPRLWCWWWRTTVPPKRWAWVTYRRVTL